MIIKSFCGILILSACSCGMENMPFVSKKPAVFRFDTSQVLLDFYYLNRGYILLAPNSGKKKFISSEIILERAKAERKNIFICSLPSDTSREASIFNSNIINTIEYDSIGNVVSIHSGSVSYDKPRSFFPEGYRDSFIYLLQNQYDTLSISLKNYLMQVKKQVNTNYHTRANLVINHTSNAVKTT